MSEGEKKSYEQKLADSVDKIAELEKSLLVLAMVSDYAQEELESMVAKTRAVFSVDLSNVKEGEESQRVGVLQARLNLVDAKDDTGRRLDRDNDFEDLTRQALENFQMAVKLPVTGKMDEKTALELNNQRVSELEGAVKSLSSFEGTRV